MHVLVGINRARSSHRREENCMQKYWGETCGKGTMEVHRHRWKGNIKISLNEIGWDGVD
jgi:hypothetical protein